MWQLLLFIGLLQVLNTFLIGPGIYLDFVATCCDDSNMMFYFHPWKMRSVALSHAALTVNIKLEFIT